jgi:hypothetical protein
MMAMETILCHSDSYSMNRNNYRLYHDPATDKIVFMPHGMDRVLGTHRSALDLAIVPPALGLVARAVLSTPEGHAVTFSVSACFYQCFRPDQLCRRVCEIDSRIASEKADGPIQQAPAEEVQDRNRISERAAELKVNWPSCGSALTPRPNLDDEESRSLPDGNPDRDRAIRNLV